MNPSLEVTILRFEPEDQRQKTNAGIWFSNPDKEGDGTLDCWEKYQFFQKISPASESMRGYVFMNRGNRIRTCDLLVPNQALYQAELCPDDSIIYCLMLAVSTQGWEC